MPRAAHRSKIMNNPVKSNENENQNGLTDTEKKTWGLRAGSNRTLTAELEMRIRKAEKKVDEKVSKALRKFHGKDTITADVIRKLWNESYDNFRIAKEEIEDLLHGVITRPELLEKKYAKYTSLRALSTAIELLEYASKEMSDAADDYHQAWKSQYDAKRRR